MLYFLYFCFLSIIIYCLLSIVTKQVLFAFGIAILTAMPIAIVACRFVLWQNLTFIFLLGYATLNYGFANWSLHLGNIPVPLGHLLAFAALFLAINGKTREVKAFLREPVFLLWLLLSILAFGHLIIDIPRFGGYAIRDASFVSEGIFLLLGFIWAKRAKDVNLFLKVLSILFFVIFAYSLTYPIKELLLEISPKSGIFLEVPLLGSYSNISFFLVIGSFYYLLVARRILRWPSAVLLVFAFLQIGWSFVFQVRSMYVGIAISLLILILLGGVRKGVKSAIILISGIIILFFIMIGLNVGLQGRIGPIETDFYVQHLRSMFLVPDTPGVGSWSWRFKLLPQIWKRWSASTTTIVLGEGFGEPLVDLINPKGTVVRQPHNTHITVLMRLGLVGFIIWGFMHWKILSLFIRSLRNFRKGSIVHDVILWLFLFYVLGMLMTSVQPWLEFSYGAIPFYTLMGFSLGLLRDMQTPPTISTPQYEQVSTPKLKSL